MSIRALLLATLLCFPAVAVADPGMCPGEADRAQLLDLRDRVAAADSPESARRMALAQTRLGHKALRQAGRLLPRSAEISEAEARLVHFEAAIGASTTQAEVAGQIDALASTAGIGAGDCDYSNVEIAIIIVGFILGILPGILFLFLFC